MVSKDRSWWQKAIKALIVVAVLVVAVVLIYAVVRFYGTGFDGYTKITTAHTNGGPSSGAVTKTEEYQPGKTLWDWLQLLFIPALLSIGAVWFTARQNHGLEIADRQHKADSELAIDNQRETALQEYIDKMSELLLHEKLRASQPEDEVRKIARVRTLTVLPHLDGTRKRSVLQFLYESDLIDKDKRILDLSEADLSEADLRGADFRGANLSGANLYRANLSGVNLSRANLYVADLSDTDLSGANLSGANLNGADLSDAYLSDANLSKAYLSDANLSNANLGGANLVDADLVEANLSRANLGGANLSRANLGGADPSRADLSKANLKDAKITKEQLDAAMSLKGATIPDGSKHF